MTAGPATGSVAPTVANTVASTLALTPSQTIGPFLAMGMEPLERRDIVLPGAPGSFRLSGTVRDADDVPVPDAVLELWQASPDGTFVSSAGADGTEPWFGRCLTDAGGRYRFTTVKPGPVPLHTGQLQAPHLEVLLFARGLLRHVRTRIYFADEVEANDADPVLRAIPAERRCTLVATQAEDGFAFDVRLRGAGETVFFAC